MLHKAYFFTCFLMMSCCWKPDWCLQYHPKLSSRCFVMNDNNRSLLFPPATISPWRRWKRLHWRRVAAKLPEEAACVIAGLGRGCFHVCAPSVFECAPKCCFHSSKGFDYHTTFVPWLRCWCRDSNYLPVSHLKLGKTPGGDDDDDAADKSGERWMDRIWVAIRLRGMMPNKTQPGNYSSRNLWRVYFFFCLSRFLYPTAMTLVSPSL